MPRAKRHYIPGYIWHITHRCHKREFLLKFSKDRRRWLHWLYEARRRYGLTILNYRGRKVRGAAEAYQLREPSALYGGHFGVKNEGIGPEPIIGTFMMNNQ